jgi:iron(III) transport system permease protein
VIASKSAKETSSKVSLSLFAPSLKLMTALICLGMVLPIIYLVLRAFAGGTAAVFESFLSWDMATLIGRSMGLAFTVSLCATLIAVPAAVFSCSDMPLAGALTVLFALPLAFPSYVGAMAMIAMFERGGLFETWTGFIAANPKGFIGAAATLSGLTFPYVFLPVRSALLKLDPSLLEAGRGLGLTPSQCFFKITLPLLKPAILSGALLVMLYTLSDFGAVSLLQFDSFTEAIYSRYDSSGERQAASVISLILIAITVCILFGESWIRGHGALHSSRSSVHLAREAALGRWRGPALLFSWTIVTVTLLLPLAVIGTWFLRGLRIEESMGISFALVWSSLKVSGLAALAAVLCAIPVAYLNTRYRSWLGRFSEKVIYIGFALPGIVIALALVLFAKDIQIYQTIPLLIFAYVLRFLPQALGTTKTALLQTSPTLEEAARTLGYGPFQVFYRITLPLIVPGLKAGAVLVFLTTVKELPVTCIVSPPGFESLATRIWSYTEEGFFAKASVPSLVLITIAALPMLLMGHKMRSDS